MSTAIETPYTPPIIATAPESSGQIPEKIQESFSFIPNLMAIFGNNPTVLEGYSALHGFRRIFSRFENLDVIFLAFLQFALIIEALRLV